MPIKVRQGWVAPTPDGVVYNVNGHKPTGVFVENISGTCPKLQYAGSGVDAGDWFELPFDPDFLRDIAAAIEKVADDVESNRR